LSQDEKWRIPVSLSQVDPLFIKALIRSEDRLYWYHPGINPFSVLRALWQNIREGRVVSGASTLTMQLARLIRPSPRNILSKIKEALFALTLETFLKKKLILELYLSLAPYGGNLEGIYAASLSYFGKPPGRLAPHEIAFLLTLPRAPSLPREKRKAMRDTLLRKMWGWGLIGSRELERGLKMPLPTRKPFPKKAPHLCDFLVERLSGVFVRSTVDAEVQGKVEKMVGLHRRRLSNLGASQAAVVVIENSSGKLKAAVGSVDYWNSPGGQIKGFYIFRSPGSALKPFIYIMALEKGVITTQSLLPDAPMSFGGFSPKNFDSSWRGLVKAEDALSLSLNLPFVYLLRRVGYWDFLRRLERGGVKGPLPDSFYGLSAAIGGMEVRLLDLTNLYASLARGGLYRRVLMVKGEETPSERLFRAGAVYLSLKALGRRGRPDAPSLRLFTFPDSVVYWKTGTSWGRRDAWAVGFSRRYTVGVWVGNFDSRGAAGIVGAQAAGPLMFDVFRALERKGWDGRYGWFSEAKRELVPEKVCSFSGYPPSPACPHTKEVLVLENSHPYLKCPFHREFVVERESGHRVCPFKTYEKGETLRRSFLVLPTAVREVLGKGNPPSFGPDCYLPSGAKLRILSPQPGATYVLSPGIRGADRLVFQAISGVGKIYWFCDGKFLGTSSSGEAVRFSLPPGPHRILAQGEEGDSSSVKIRVILW